MTDTTLRRPFLPGFPDVAGVITWIHVGDLHMTKANEPNHLDLVSIVKEINDIFTGSVAFVYLPGDIAEHGTVAEYDIVRQVLKPLKVPWCSIVGDHDVHEKSFANYLAFAGHSKHYAFQIGHMRFLALNAFDVPDPGAFCLLPEQLAWLEEQIGEIAEPDGMAVLFLHCYPTDLKQGSDRLRAVIENSAVRLIDMGHTHYNELANDGKTLYTATRSTGQIEEGPVGFSITNLDGRVISWKFVRLSELPIVMITSPADERFITDPALEGHIASDTIRIRAKAWSQAPIGRVKATIGDQTLALSQIRGSNVWEGSVAHGLPAGVHALRVSVEDVEGASAEDCVRMVIGAHAYVASERVPRDQNNVVPAWPERGLLGTQLGPNKNGRKW